MRAVFLFLPRPLHPTHSSPPPHPPSPPRRYWIVQPVALCSCCSARGSARLGSARLESQSLIREHDSCYSRRPIKLANTATVEWSGLFGSDGRQQTAPSQSPPPCSKKRHRNDVDSTPTSIIWSFYTSLSTEKWSRNRHASDFRN